MFKQTKKALLLSVLMLVVCLSMLIGTTYAWFTDSASSDANIIQAGNLDVKMEWAAGTADPATTSWNATEGTEAQPIFNNNKWEPGYAEVRHIKISNKGSLALKYKVLFKANGQVSDLADVIDVYYADPAKQVRNKAEIANLVDLGKMVKLGTLTQVLASLGETGNGELLAGQADTITLALVMQETAGNEYAGKSIGDSFTIKVLATQLSYENDSFGKDYDANSAVFTVAKANEMLAKNENVVLTGCMEPNSIIYVPANYTGILTLSDVEIASIQQLDAPTTISTEATESSFKIEILGDVKVIATKEEMSAITGKNINIVGTGTLTAIAKGKAAFGIGGKDTKSININGVKIAYVEGGYAYGVGSDTNYYKDAPEGGAAIGSGYNGATINLNNVTIIKAIGGSKSAAIGARYHVGVSVTINNSTIEYAEGGVSAAAIGGSRVSSGATEDGTRINIEKSTITVKGGAYGAGIGSGYDTHCLAKQPMCEINISESDINAQGGKYAAGVGTGYHNAALKGEIKNSVVNATPGDVYYKESYTLATGIGFGVVDPAREGKQTDSYINYNGETIKIGTPFKLVKTDEELANAIAEGKTDILLGEDTYVIPASAQGKTLHFVGLGDKTVIATNTSGSYEGCNYNLLGATVVFENVNITTDNKTYTGYANANLTFINCTINNSITLYGDTVFENCTLNVSGDQYNVWTWAAPNATFNNCTLNSDGKSLLLYGGGNTKLTLNSCVFNDSGVLPDLKAAIEIGSDYGTSNFEVYVNNTIVNGYEITDKGINTGTTLWGNKNSMTKDKLNVVVDGTDVY